MNAQDAAWQAGQDAFEVPRPGVRAAGSADFGASVLRVLARAGTRPAEVAAAWLRFGSALARPGPGALARWRGSEVDPPVPADARDRRFANVSWDANPGYFALRQAYLATRRLGTELLVAGRGDPVTPACSAAPATSSGIWRRWTTTSIHGPQREPGATANRNDP